MHWDSQVAGPQFLQLFFLMEKAARRWKSITDFFLLNEFVMTWFKTQAVVSVVSSKCLIHQLSKNSSDSISSE